MLQSQGFGSNIDASPHGGGAADAFRVRTIVSPSSGGKSILSITLSALDQAAAVANTFAAGYLSLVILKGKGNPLWNDGLTGDLNASSLSLLQYVTVDSSRDRTFKFDVGELTARDGEFIHVAIGGIIRAATGLPTLTNGFLTVLGVDHEKNIPYETR